MTHRFPRALGLSIAIGMAAVPATAQTSEMVTVETGGPPASNQAGEAAGANVLVALVRDVGRDYKNFLLSKDTAVWLGIGGAMAATVHPVDESISQWAAQGDTSLKGGDTYGSQWLHIPVALAWWVTASAVGSGRNAEAGRDLLRAQLSTVSWTYAVKLATQRTRPNGDPHSFPSGHASTSFATAMVLQQHYGWKLGLPALAMATYTGVSRVYANQHWASDVVFGAAVGMVSGRTVTVRLRDQKVSFAPSVAPGGVIVQVRASR